MLVEKVDTTLQEIFKGLKEEDLISIFKILKDKIIGMIQKDTNAGVRDAAVSLLTTFKALLFDHQAINEEVNTLPKYRVVEINKEAIERRKQLYPQASIEVGPQRVGSARPVSAGVFGEQ